MLHEKRCIRGPQTCVLGLRVVRLRLNDGEKLWISFKLCFKTNIFYRAYWRNILYVTVNFSARKFTKFMAQI